MPRFIYLPIILLFAATFSASAWADIPDPDSISCPQYQDIVAQEHLSKNQRAYQAMRQRVLGLCHDWFTGEGYYLEQYGKYTWDGANFAIVSNLTDRLEHKGLSEGVYDILNYPRLNDLLSECYPGTSVTAKFHRWYFKESLAYVDRAAYENGSASGLIAVTYAPFKLMPLLTKLPIVARATGYVASLPPIAQYLSTRAWVLRTFPFMAKTWVKVTVLFGGTAVGTAGYVGWKDLHANGDGTPVRVAVADPATPTNPAAQSAQPTAMDLIDGITAQDLFSSDLAAVKTEIQQAVRQYGTSRGTIPLRSDDQFSDLSTDLDISESNCVQSIQMYKRDPMPDNLVDLKQQCEKYFHNIHYSLGLLKYPAVRCVAVNDGITYRINTQLDGVVSQLPADAFTGR